MKINILEFIFKIIILISAFYGVYINFLISEWQNMFLYFTTLSNISILFFYAVCMILYFHNKFKKNNIYYIFKGMITVNITLTFAVYNFMLSSLNLYSGFELESLFVHILTPGLVILDYIIFGEKGNLNKMYPLYWSLSLVAYTLVCWMYVICGGLFIGGTKYPYFYMNFDEFGYFGVMINCFVILIIYLLYSYFIVFLDHLSKKQLKEVKKQ